MQSNLLPGTHRAETGPGTPRTWGIKTGHVTLAIIKWVYPKGCRGHMPKHWEKHRLELGRSSRHRSQPASVVQRVAAGSV